MITLKMPDGTVLYKGFSIEKIKVKLDELNNPKINKISIKRRRKNANHSR